MSAPSPQPGFVLEELDDELLLFNPQDGRLLEVNATAALVWQLCDGRRTTEEITALLAETYPEAADQIAGDIPRILHDLQTFGAIIC